MIRLGFAAAALLVAGCSTTAVRTPEQAKDIALASECARAEITLDPNEKMPTEWVAERRGDRWYVWLPNDSAAGMLFYYYNGPRRGHG